MNGGHAGFTTGTAPPARGRPGDVGPRVADAGNSPACAGTTYAAELEVLDEEPGCDVVLIARPEQRRDDLAQAAKKSAAQGTAPPARRRRRPRTLRGDDAC
nr:hypothetical protein [Actinosynnema sp. ALI-1.44]